MDECCPLQVLGPHFPCVSVITRVDQRRDLGRAHPYGDDRYVVRQLERNLEAPGKRLWLSADEQLSGLELEDDVHVAECLETEDAVHPEVIVAHADEVFDLQFAHPHFLDANQVVVPAAVDLHPDPCGLDHLAAHDGVGRAGVEQERVGSLAVDRDLHVGASIEASIVRSLNGIRVTCSFMLTDPGFPRINARCSGVSDGAAEQKETSVGSSRNTCSSTRVI